jgi:putative glutamine amidotransferase
MVFHDGCAAGAKGEFARMKKPLIGVTPSPADDDYLQGIFNCDYTAAVEAAGGIPLILPLQSEILGEILAAIDGLVLIGGGGDVGPYRYGDQTIHPATDAINDRRDELEIALVRAAVALDLPMLAICRGSQIVNVALGGGMYQDIPDQHGREIEHAQAKLGVDSSEPTHTVTVEPGSLLERVYGRSVIDVNSDHHQASKSVSSELRVAGRAQDGIIEAVERPAGRFVLGLQWHPELMFRRHPEHLGPFGALVAKARIEQRVRARNGAALEV